jgi:hypothetical protein
MSDRYEALERLQRLRESGALTDEEFQAEKRRILGHDVGATQERVTEVEVDGARRSRMPLYLSLAAAALVIAIAIGLLVGRNVRGSEQIEDLNIATSAPAEGPAETNLLNVAPPPVQDVRSLPKTEQLGRAFAAAFGGAQGQATAAAHGQNVVYKPRDLFWIGDRAVLISAGPSTDDCHACAGALAVHYLRAAGDKFEVTGSWPDAITGAGWGAAPKWRMTNVFTSFPAIYEQGSGGGQGYVCSVARIVELAPSGPVTSGPIPLHYDNEGAVTDEQAKVSIDGKIVSVKKDAAFDVAYTGSQTFTQSWVKQGDRFVAQGEQSKALQC